MGRYARAFQTLFIFDTPRLAYPTHSLLATSAAIVRICLASQVARPLILLICSHLAFFHVARDVRAIRTNPPMIDG